MSSGELVPYRVMDQYDQIAGSSVPIPMPTLAPAYTGPSRPVKPADVRDFIRMQHPEYREYVGITRQILDTLEAGERYRDATYGRDAYGYERRNLIRQRREYPMDMYSSTNQPLGRQSYVASYRDVDEYNRAIHEEYETRRTRTPVPTFLPSYINKQLSTVYKEEIQQKGPPEIADWFENIDGRNTTLKDWMRETVGPLMLALGMLDIYIDHPRAPEGVPILSMADARAAQLNRAVAKFILPENIPWWELDYTQRYYTQVRITEWAMDRKTNNYVRRHRHWDSRSWVLWDDDGNTLDQGDHSFGLVPIIRVFDRRNFRLDHSAASRYWGIVDKSRAYYNEESEIITLNTLHNSPLLQGPEDQDTGAGESIPIGKNFMLVKLRDVNGNYIGYEYVQPNTGNLIFASDRTKDLQSRMEAEIGMTRPMGAVPGGQKGQVAQSGISKAFDQEDADTILSGIANRLASAHYDISLLALLVLHDGQIPAASLDQLHVVYPRRFNLLKFEDIAGMSTAIQQFIMNGIGKIPDMEKRTLRLMYRTMLVGLDVEEYNVIDKQIDSLVDAAVKSGTGSQQPAIGAGGPGPGSGPGGPAANIAAQMNQLMTQARTHPINIDAGASPSATGG